MSLATDNDTIVNANADQEPLIARRHSPLPPPQQPPLGIVVHPKNRTKAPYVIRAWAAVTPEERMAGLQFQTDLAEDCGLLFVFPGTYFWAMWMQNTPIPLDIVFLQSQFTSDGGGVLKVVEVCSGEPHSLTSIIPKATCDMVLEVPAGTFGFEERRDRGVDHMTVSGYQTALLRAVRTTQNPNPFGSDSE